MILCVPDSQLWRSVYKGAISELMHGRIWDRTTGTITEAQAIAREVYFDMSTCNLEAVFFSMNEINERIAAALEMIASKPACCPDTIGQEMPEEPLPGYPPIGPGEDFSDVPAYKSYKCQAATYLMQRMEGAFDGMVADGVQSKLALGVAIVTGSLAYILPSQGLAKLISGLGTLSALVSALITGEDLSVSDMADAISGNQTDFICALYCGVNVENSISMALDVLSGLGLSDAEYEFVSLFFQPNLVNWLYSFQPTINESGIFYDCSGCGCDDVPCGYLFGVDGETVLGSGAFDYSQLPSTISSVPYAGVHTMVFAMPCDLETECTGWNYCLEFNSTTITTGLAASWTRRITSSGDDCGTSMDIYDDEFPPLGVRMPINSCHFSNPDPFEVVLTIWNSTGPVTDPPSTAVGCEA